MIPRMYAIVAHDVNSPLIRNELWTRFPVLWKKMFGLPIAHVAVWSKNDMIAYCLRETSWIAPKTAFIGRIERRPAYLREIIDLANGYGEEMNATTAIAATADLQKWSAADLARFFDAFVELQTREYAVGVLLALLDFIGESYMETQIRKYLERKLPLDAASGALALFTAPAFDSFALEQEHELLKLSQRFFKIPTVKRAITSKRPREVMQFLKSRYPTLDKQIRQHALRFGWVYYVYKGPAYGPEEFLGFMRDWLHRNIDPGRELKKRTREQRTIRQKRQALLKRLKPDRLRRALLELTPLFVWAKPHRKDLQSKTYWHMEFFYREVARRYGYTLQQIRSASIRQIHAILRGYRIAPSILTRQRKEHVTYNDARGVRILVGQPAARFVKSRFYEEHHKLPAGNELKGTTAFAGSASGAVRIINVPDDMKKMGRGDILVSFATTPSIVPAMKKAAAIITDEGGLTCHAAIVSRELKIPCVIGTKVATKALKDGDCVEVDANAGTVRLIRS